MKTTLRVALGLILIVAATQNADAQTTGSRLVSTSRSFYGLTVLPIHAPASASRLFTTR